MVTLASWDLEAFAVHSEFSNSMYTCCMEEEKCRREFEWTAAERLITVSVAEAGY